MRADPIPDHYKVLGVSPDADAAVVRAAYLALVRLHHPDGADAADRAAAEQRTKEINAAFAVIGDSRRRSDYDAARQRAAPGAWAGRAPADPLRPQTPAWGGGPYRKRTRRKGPTLAARQKRLDQVRSFSIGLGVAALVLIFAGFTVALSLMRPGVLDPLAAPFGSRSAAGAIAADLDTPDIVPDVMLPWPDMHPGQSRSFSGRGLKVTFEGQRGDAGVRMTVNGPDEETFSIAAPARVSSERANLFGVGRLNEKDRADTLLVATWTGDDCCMRVQALGRGKDGWRLVELGDWPSATASDFPRDLNGDGRREWVLGDDRFIAAFGPSTPLPPKVVQFNEGKLRDVSGSGHFGQLYMSHLGGAQRLCALGSRGGCAAFVADAARLGRIDWAWDIMLRNHAKDQVEAAADCNAGGDARDCAAAADAAFPRVLERFLKRAGYVEDNLALPLSADPAA